MTHRNGEIVLGPQPQRRMLIRGWKGGGAGQPWERTRPCLRQAILVARPLPGGLTTAAVLPP